MYESPADRAERLRLREELTTQERLEESELVAETLRLATRELETAGAADLAREVRWARARLAEWLDWSSL